MRQTQQTARSACCDISVATGPHREGDTERFVVPIPGTRNVEHLNENLGALTVELTPAEVGQISAESAAITVQGERMDDTNMQLVE
jgi:hypothetical protein